MAPSTELLIGDAGADHVLIRPLTRTHPGLFDAGDGSGIDCEVEIAAGGFRASFRADLRSEEFQAFLDGVQGLRQALDGAASFTASDGQIALSLTAGDDGQVRVSGDAVDAAGANRLRFGFDLDQTFLPTICESLEHLLAAYPVTDSPAV